MSFTRRRFLQHSAAASTVLATGLPAARAAATDLDVAIVGGGVAGAYAAWRLKVSPDSPWRDKKIALFEMSERVGGRLFSPRFPDTPNLPVELGGMRYVVTEGHRTVVEHLIPHVGLRTAQAPVGSPENIYYLRGKRLRQRQLRVPADVPYKLPPAAAGKTADEIIMDAILRVEPNARSLKPDAWAKLKRDGQYRGRPLIDWSLTDLLKQPIAEGVPADEVYAFVRDALGYTSLVEPWNLAEAMPWMVSSFAPGSVYHTIVSGMQTLPIQLAAGLGRQGTVPNRRLTRIDRIDKASFRLTFTTVEGRQEPVTAARVILALPPRAIALLDPESVVFQAPQFRQDLASVQGQPMTKLFLGFASPWWQRAGVRAGRSVTDMELRQIFYFGTEPGTARSLLMASYNDGPAHDFWAKFAKGAPVPGGPFWYMSDPMIKEVRSQLTAVHGVDAPGPSSARSAMMADWGADPYGGAYHLWNVGTKSWEVMPRIRNPLPDGGLFVCGEAWSIDQGWINGALQTAERMLQSHFALRRPAWLPTGVDLGP